jgi:hypothetical protein
LASWASPAERDYRTANLKTFKERGGTTKGEQLQNQVKHLADWTTPSATDGERGGKITDAMTGTSLTQKVELAAWPTPLNQDSESSGGEGALSRGTRGHTLTSITMHIGPVRFTASGEVLTGLDAGTESSGQLNPEHSLWLMGIPREWASFGLRAMQSVSQRRKRSSKRTSKAKG